MSERLPRPCRIQLDLHNEIVDLDEDPLYAVDLHKAKFDQRKTLQEYRDDRPLAETLPGNVYEPSKGMVMARGEDLSQISVEDAWTEIGDGETWVGSLPVRCTGSSRMSTYAAIRT
jgi:hypothetical protein